MNFCVRLDDVGWSEQESPSPPLKLADRGLELARRFHAAMQGLPYLAAVIPSALDRDGLAWLQTAPAGMTIAMHGFNHRISVDGVASEFRHLDLEQCRQRIECGRVALKDVPIEHLVLPFNCYEPDLAEACYQSGINYIWGGGEHGSGCPSRWPTPPQPYSLGRVTFVPSWAPTYAATLWRMGPEDRPLESVLPRLLDLPGKAVLTLHITWECCHSADFCGVKWLVAQLGDRAISVEEYLRTQ